MGKLTSPSVFGKTSNSQSLFSHSFSGDSSMRESLQDRASKDFPKFAAAILLLWILKHTSLWIVLVQTQYQSF